VQQRRLNAVNLGGQSSVAVAQAQAQKAAADNVYAQTQAVQTRIVAPFSGQIQTVTSQANDPLRTIQIGDAVTQGAALFTIAEGSGYIVQAQVDEQDIAQVRTGQRAIVSGEDFNGASFPGHVATIAPTAQKSTDTSSTTKQVLTTIALDTNSSLLKDGMTADVDIVTTDIPNAVTVPTSAIVATNGKKYVWIVRDTTLHKIAVVTGQSNDTLTVITRGVASGDRVVTAPLATFTEGMPVTVSQNATA
jgi:HlyD family secretion protein